MATIDVYLSGGPLDGQIRPANDDAESLFLLFDAPLERPESTRYRLTSMRFTDGRDMRIAVYIPPTLRRSGESAS